MCFYDANILIILCYLFDRNPGKKTIIRESFKRTLLCDTLLYSKFKINQLAFVFWCRKVYRCKELQQCIEKNITVNPKQNYSACGNIQRKF